MKKQINLPFRVIRHYVQAHNKWLGSMPTKEQLDEPVKDALHTTKHILANGLDVGGIVESVKRVQLVSYKDRLMFRDKEGIMYDYWDNIHFVQKYLTKN